MLPLPDRCLDNRALAETPGRDPMNSAVPKVSVLLPVRDGEPFFAEALDSILFQSGVNFEVVVVDDGSSDGTSERLLACDDPRLVVIRREGEGLVAALNCALAAARGEFVARMDADDIALAGRLALQAEFLDTNPAVNMVHSSVLIIDEAGRGSRQLAALPYSAEQRRAILLDESAGAPIIHPSVMMRRAALLAVGGYRNSPSCEDHELWLRVVDQWQIAGLPEVLLHYRQHARGISRTRTKEQAISNLTNCIAYRFRGATDLDLYAQAPKRYQALRALVEKRAGKMLEAASLAKSARRDFRQGRWGNAVASVIQLANQRDLFLLSNRVLRNRILALQLDLLTDFEKGR